MYDARAWGTNASVDEEPSADNAIHVEKNGILSIGPYEYNVDDANNQVRSKHQSRVGGR